MSEYEVVIGLEIHIQLNTESKMFSGDSNKDTLEPNINVSPISLGHPGTLPVVNKNAIISSVKLGLALNCDIARFTKFDRKHYFYPDLPKGYQISQYDLPIGSDGEVCIVNDAAETIKIGIERIHMEEDAAKNVHTDKVTLVDFNRAGTPLIEIVSRPDIKTPQTARLYLQELQTLVRYLDISDADMEKGHMRVDANISLRPLGDEALYPKTEIKNVNSFRAIEKALTYEIKRQTELWDKNQAPEITETRGWDESKQETYSQRTKEDAADYRYFPEPDIPPFTFTDEEIDKYARTLPELPAEKRARFREEYLLSYYDAKVITNDPKVAEYYERVISELKAWLYSLDTTEGSDEEIWLAEGKKLTRITCNWITSNIFGILTKKNLSFKELKISPENLAEFITLIYQAKINSSAAQTILDEMFNKGSDPSQVMEEKNLEQVSDKAQIESICNDIIIANPKVVEDYKTGKERVLMFLVGKVMKEMKGKANPQIVTDILKNKINKE